MTYIYVDGDIVDKADAHISVYDHGLLYGDGIYEGMRCYSGVVFQAEEHLDRLARSAKCLRIDLPPRIHIWGAILDALEANQLDDAYIRLVVTRGVGSIGPDPGSCGKPSILVITEPLPPLHGAQAVHGLSACIVSTRRNPVDGVTGQVKSLNYLGSVLARAEASAAGAAEAIMLDSRGMVAEAPVCNVMIVHNGRLSTPGDATGVLRGITRDFVMALARSEGISTEERDITPYELLVADEVFLSGTHAEMVPIAAVNGVAISNGQPGPIYGKLVDKFRDATKSVTHGWPVER